MTTRKHTAGFQTLALSSIHESTTNPRRTFDESQAGRACRFCARAQNRPFVPQTVLLPRKRGAAWKQAAPLRNRHITITASQAISTAVDRHAILSLGEVIPKFRLEGDKPPQQPAWSSR